MDAHVYSSAKLPVVMGGMTAVHRNVTSTCHWPRGPGSIVGLAQHLYLAHSSFRSGGFVHGVSITAAARRASDSSSAPTPRRDQPCPQISSQQLQQMLEGPAGQKQDHAPPHAQKQRPRPSVTSRRSPETHEKAPAALNTSQPQRQQQQLASDPHPPTQMLPSILPLSPNPSRLEVHEYLKSIQGTRGFMTDEHLGRVSQYLSDLNEEQWGAVLCNAQHLRLIAGPGSGKTRTIAARVAWLLANNTPPEQFLVITFTRKAAGELVERLTELMGPAVTRRLRPCTFHALCNSLLRKYQTRLNTEDFAIATEDDVEEIIRAIVYPDNTASVKGSSKMLPQHSQHASVTQNASGLVRSSRATAGGSSTGVPGADYQLGKTGPNRTKNKDLIRFYRSAISRLKNFVQEVEGRSGLELIQQTQAVGLNLVPVALTPAVAQVYDQYQQKMRSSNMLDFDDLLHRCLSLVKSDSQVRAALHSRFQHVLVDESQDTNPCQFELVREITGPQAALVMVGDPDQAIYGFRGANSQLLSQVFSGHYPTTAETCYLSRNYRSREPITRVADIVRRQHRAAASLFKQGISMRPMASRDTVILVQEENQYREADYVMKQIRHWRHVGYLLGEMALLFRTRDSAQFMYRQLTKNGIPAHMPLGKDFWDSAEVKTAMAMLRCLVQPTAAGEMIKRQLVKKSGLQVPIMIGIGDTAMAKLDEHIKNTITSSDSNSSSRKHPATLGSCLLHGCDADDMTAADAAYTVQQWWSADSELYASLEQLAPPWCPPEGFTGIKTKKARAAVARLRGMVVLGRAAAVTQTPAQVMKLLLTASGAWASLRHAASVGDDDAVRRLSNLDVLLDLASNTRAYDNELAAETEQQLIDMLTLSSFEEPTTTTTSSSSSVDKRGEPPTQQQAVGMAILRSFYDFCVLQGEGDEDQNAGAKKVQLLTMHASKGKEFPCVGVMRVCDSVVPCLRADDHTPNALEQERNTLFVALTRAKDHLLVSWPDEMLTPGHPPHMANKQEVSRFLKPVLDAYRAEQLPGVDFVHHDSPW